MPVLHHDRVVADGAPTPARWMLVLHGIYGAGRNWGSLARRFVRERPEWGALPTDLRGHGRSPAFEPPHTLDACAGDLARLVEAEALDARAVLGHSFGGKVALVYARQAPVPLERVWLIDSTPDTREPEGSAWRMLSALRDHPGPFRSREEAALTVEDAGFAPPVASWMTTNVERGGDGAYRWQLDLDLMEALLVDFFETDAWDVVEAPPEGCHLHVVQASESSVLDDRALARIEAAAADTGRVHLHRVEGGHWLNADNPDALHALLVEHMPAGERSATGG
jgi:pimeloyl-ACP methyl ester carboxylesterase